MKIFISWSGQRSHHLARILREWLPEIVQQIEPWLSSTDISKGELWGKELGASLAEYNQGIVCVTPENMTSPWLNYEAGALAKSLAEARIRPLLLDLRPSDVVGPLNQFQLTAVRDQADMLTFVKSINLHCARPLDEQRLEKVFVRSWPDFQAELERVLGLSAEAVVRDDNDMLREVLDRVRNMERHLFGGADVPMPRWGVTTDTPLSITEQ